MKKCNDKAVATPFATAAGKKLSVALLHYSCPPVIGGVESVVEAHARLCSNAGFRVRVVVGKGGQLHPRVRTMVVPAIDSTESSLRKTMDSLKKGRVPADFAGTVRAVEAALRPALRDVDVCIVHNVMTMHFNLALTAALANIARRARKTRFIAWCHDSTFTDSSYKRHQHEGYPWSLLRQRLPGFDYCVISQQSQKELARLFKVPPARFPVIPDGVSISSLLGLTPKALDLYRTEQLYNKDIIAVTPARIVRRKNLEVGLHIVSAFRKMGKDIRWIVTGAPDHHNTDSAKYFKELLTLRARLELENDVIFLCERFKHSVDSDTLRALLAVSDMLLFPSRKEGFGIPVLEAGLNDLVLILGDIPALREIAGPSAVYIPQKYNASRIARQAWSAFQKSPRLCFRNRIIREYSWSAVFVKKILPAIIEPERIWGADHVARGSYAAPGG